MSNKTNNRGQFSSSLGFILASSGSAIGLGNLWKFPYVAGSSGGGLFLIFYLIFALVLGVPLLITEISIGRKTRLNPIGSYQILNKNSTIIGVFGVLASFIILSYYSVVGGWVLKYFFTYLTGGNFGNDTSNFFNSFITSSFEPLVWHIIFMAISTIIVIGGVSKGIEKASKFMLPGLFVLIIILCVRSVTLDGASAGIKFLLMPHPYQLSGFSNILEVMESALGQVFFSLSIGTGIGITYGSYLKKDSNIPKNSFIIAGLDTMIAVLAGIAILPAVFALGFEPTAGPGLIFNIVPAVFSNMPFGKVFGFLFFMLVMFAAITSSISMLEVVTSYLIDNFKLNRKISTIIIALLTTFIGIFASLSMGPFSDVKIMGNNLFDFLGFLTDKILMPLTGILTCIFIGHIFKVKRLSDEISQGIPGGKFKLQHAYEFTLKWIAPVLIFIVFIFGLI